jgi:hypothetical protein
MTSLSKLLNNPPSWAASELLTVKSVITDYLKYIGGLALKAIDTQESKESFDRDSVLWCTCQFH